jgi:homocitrate synthase
MTMTLAPTVAPGGASRLTLVDTTLREGEQFAGAHFSSAQRVELARRLDAFGVDIIELPSPRVSPATATDGRAIATLELRARVVAHLRCDPKGGMAAVVGGERR